MEVTYALGAQMLKISGVETNNEMAIQKLQNTIKSGDALKKFRQFIKAQGGNELICDDYSLLPQAKFKVDLISQESGYITEINTYQIGMTAIEIGAGRKKKEDKIDHSTGFIFSKNVGDSVEKNESILTIYTNDMINIENIKDRLYNSIKISKTAPENQKMIYYYIDKNGVIEY
jgi:pyrimidine-nucleoside phosphorylase